MTKHEQDDLFKPTPKYTEHDLRRMWRDFQDKWQRRGYDSEDAEQVAESFIRGITGRATYHRIPKERRFLKDDSSLYPGLI
jgi:hypothetical protein